MIKNKSIEKNYKNIILQINRKVGNEGGALIFSSEYEEICEAVIYKDYNKVEIAELKTKEYELKKYFPDQDQDKNYILKSSR